MMRVSVLEMHQHFLYLPFYVAKNADFYGYLADCNVQFDSVASKTDVGVLDALYSERHRSSAAFAICDPAPLLDMEFEEGRTPAILAAMVVNAAIWAVDKEAEPVQTFDELRKFQKVISFERGTTTYGIARRIVGSASLDRIQPVSPGMELPALLYERDAIALSPDILHAIDVQAVGVDRTGGRRKIILPIGGTPEYSNVMVTALITRKDVVDRHPQIAAGMVRAIQRSTHTVKHKLDDVVQFAVDRFDRSEDHVSQALDMANDCHVFPETVLIKKVQWENACRAYAEASHRRWDARARARVQESYSSMIIPFAHMAADAAKNELLDGRKPPRSIWESASTWKYIAAALLAMFFLSGSILYLHPRLSEWSIEVLCVLLALVGAGMSRLHRLRLRSARFWVHAAMYCIGVLLLYLTPSLTSEPFRSFAMAIVPAIPLLDLGVYLTPRRG